MDGLEVYVTFILQEILFSRSGSCLISRFNVFFFDYFIGFFLSLCFCWMKVGFSAAPETLANHLGPIRLVSWWELYNCLVDCCFWLGSPFMLQKYSLPFFWFKNSNFIYTLLFLYVTRPWESGVVFLTVWAFSFIQAIFLWVVWIFISKIYEVCLWLSTARSKFSFLVFNSLRGCSS